MTEPIETRSVSRRTVLKGVAGVAGLATVPAIIAACGPSGASSAPSAAASAAAPSAAAPSARRPERRDWKRVSIGSNHSDVKETDGDGRPSTPPSPKRPASTSR